ncbi:hypothetical protein E4U02_13795 [Microbacterium paludicola]|uniref:Uncharacterized protein n=1 Tax=Microbacterium paludicola TaxID=300019 RepID=A0A4Y9FP80_9MICO|nr:hypothetical protein [Microbacterium paludicola]MBF0817476.1 hypothetical protein [Microbacterium paludicola]TFU31024.1 hypothetical protein E4U02_13795 [Microbacterium paludicola]
MRPSSYPGLSWALIALGTLSGLMAALFVNEAGLELEATGFVQKTYWDNEESPWNLNLGVALLVIWLLLLVAGLVIGRVRTLHLQRDDRTRLAGVWAATGSVVVLALAFAVVLWPVGNTHLVP